MTSTINASTSSGIVQTADTSGVLALQTVGTTALTINTSQQVAFTNAVNLPNTFGFKNRIINGAMMIDQRNAGASVTANDGVFAVDRFKFSMTQSSKGTGQQSTTAAAGFVNSLLFTSSSAYSVLSSDQFAIVSNTEGLNVSDLMWGTANAAPVTLSFWVRSSLTGTFGGALQNSAANRSYPFSYTISSANTWEQKTVTVAGDTTGTWLTTNGIGIRLFFSLGMGSTSSGTAGSWAGANYQSATGATSVVGTNGATFYITGVQLEKGNTATSFDFRDYGRELIMCQRYYWALGAVGSLYAWPIENSFSYRTMYVQNPVQMRTGPTIANVAVAGNYTTAPNAASGYVDFVYFQWNSVTASLFTGVQAFSASAEL